MGYKGSIASAIAGLAAGIYIGSHISQPEQACRAPVSYQAPFFNTATGSGFSIKDIGKLSDIDAERIRFAIKKRKSNLEESLSGNE